MARPAGGVVAYVLAARMLSRWPDLLAIARTRWWQWTLATLVLMTSVVLVEVARPRTDGELLSAIAARPNYNQRAIANQIVADRGESASHLAPRLRELILAEGSPSTTVWEMQTLAAIAPTPETVALLLEMAHRPYGAPAINVLGAMGPAARAAVPELLALMVLPPGGFAGETELAAARAVSRIDPQRTSEPRYQAVVEEIKTRLSHDDPRYREGAANQLGQIGRGAADAIPELQNMAAHDPVPRGRKAAAGALAAIGRDRG